MSPITHFFISWVVANGDSLNKRERGAVVLAGVVPDVDGLGIIAETLTKNSELPLLWWSKFHHVLAHNIGFGILIALGCFFIAKQRFKTALFGLAAFHLHLLCDIVGARGPDGAQWPIPYLSPFSNQLQITWDGQWAINGWPNFLITGIMLIATFYIAYKKEISPLEIVSKKGDRAFVEILKKRFGKEINQAGEKNGK